MSGFQVGDVVVVVDDGPLGNQADSFLDRPPKLLRLGKLCRITGFVVAPAGTVGVTIDNQRPFRMWDGLSGWRQSRFQKIEAPQSKIADRIRACKPQRMSA